ncbi:type II secretion system protein GspM [Caldimonas sp. KR1-144]|uniref:type II secretion system protein GspM n=1 Tax=Caldimonas sp. KR1-144 TaxID=3400911 RepID=UPI003C08CBA9
MNASADSVATALAPLRSRWQALAPRERLVLGVAAALLGLLLVWLIFVRPAVATLRSAPAQLDALDAQLQHMQRLAAEVRELRTLPPVNATQAEAALRATTERLGAAARLTLQGDRATVSFNGVAGEALAGWLGEVRSAARARPIEASLTRSPGGSYSGTLVLALGAPRS